MARSNPYTFSTVEKDTLLLVEGIDDAGFFDVTVHV